MDKYQNLARELNRLWKMNTNIIPIGLVIGACAGNNSKKPQENLSTVCMELVEEAALGARASEQETESGWSVGEV